jgi:phosphoenolpyruvate carboxykinase (ATP)
VPGAHPLSDENLEGAFDETARKLVRMLQENFVKFEQHVDADVRSAAPQVRIAAE